MNSRALHEELGIKSKHADWVARKIASLDLEEGEDYTIQEVSTTRGRTVKDYILSEEAYMLIKATSSTDILREVVHTNTKTKAILKDLEHVEIELPEGFRVFRGDVVVSSKFVAELLGVQHKNILKAIRKELKTLREKRSAPTGADPLIFLNTPEADKAIQEVLKGASESSYKDASGRSQPIVYLNEVACWAVLARYSAEVRAFLAYSFSKHQKALVQYLQTVAVSKHIPQKPLSRRYVYIISNPVTGSFKIGIAKDIEKRLQALQTGNEVELTLFYASLACSNAPLIETDVHKHFAEYRLVGEWFSSKLDKLEVIDYLKEQNYILESNFGEEHEIL